MRERMEILIKWNIEAIRQLFLGEARFFFPKWSNTLVLSRTKSTQVIFHPNLHDIIILPRYKIGKLHLLKVQPSNVNAILPINHKLDYEVV